ncbi:PadR family transcriptional regulator [Candidatus Woesearchaeota archaeon]|nr:PadR family transcriptional regulator [Candidatus Woesearchaeota archaeon]
MGTCCDMRGFLSFIVLRLISKKNMSGDELRDELAKRKGHKPSPGTIYPVLKALSENGFIQEIKSAGKIKQYRLTKNGIKELEIATRKFCEIFYDMEGEFGRCLK